MKLSKLLVLLVAISVIFTLSCGLVSAKDFIGGEFVDGEEVPPVEEPPLIEEPPPIIEPPPIEEPPVEEIPNAEPSDVVEEIPSTDEKEIVPPEPNKILSEVTQIRIALQILVFALIPIIMAVWIIKNIIFSTFRRFF